MDGFCGQLAVLYRLDGQVLAQCGAIASGIDPGDAGAQLPVNLDAVAHAVKGLCQRITQRSIIKGLANRLEYGVGLKLGRYVKDLYGTAMPVLEGLKKQLDPNGIMNPGKLGFAGC